ncbi:MAG: hypothetical protein WBK67_01785 [Minisyncoccales bacterium]|jgi:hypothetical protein
MEDLILEYLLNPKIVPSPYIQVISWMKISFIIISFLLISLIIYIFISSNWLKYRAMEDISEFVKFQPYGSDKYVKEWRKIAKRLNSGIEAEFKLAIIETDAMLGEILQKMGYNEGSTEKSLSKVTDIEIQNIEELKEARQIRNGVVHDPDYQLTKEKAKEVMDIYQESFRNLGVI